MTCPQTFTSASPFHYLAVAPEAKAAAATVHYNRCLTLLGGASTFGCTNMEPDSPPAGFFSTFSVNDPNNNSGAGASGPDGQQSRTQKRNRRVFVCLSCHRKKLKCDKNSPCGRCIANGVADECTYQALPASSSAASRSARSSEPRDSSSTRASSQIGMRDRQSWLYRASDGRCRTSGVSHWATVCSEFEEACPFLFGMDPQWEQRYTQIKNLKYLFPSLAACANFPFGNGSTYPASRDQVLDSLPPRNVVEILLRSYESSFETTHRLLHVPNFRREVDAFWADRSSVTDGWLAQLCALLALGCHASTAGTLPEVTGHAPAHWTDILLDSAQVSFLRSDYMLAPSLSTVRTLCAVVLVKKLGLRATNSWQVASLMAFVVRLATSSLQLHRSSALFPGMHALEAEARNRVWTTVQLLDLEVALWAGTTPCWREPQDADPPLNANDDEFGPSPASVPPTDGLLWAAPLATGARPRSGGSGSGTAVAAAASSDYTDATYQIRLAELLPLLSEVVIAANSPTAGPINMTSASSSNKLSGAAMEHDRAVRLDKRIRLRVRDAEASLSSGSEIRPDRVQVIAAQRQFLRVIVHRTLLALHHSFARGSGPARHEQSLRTSLESSLTLLHIQENWAASSASSSPPMPRSAATSNIVVGGRSGSVGSASPSPAIGVGRSAGQQQWQWLLDLCHDDFGVAAAYVIVALRRGDFGDDSSAALAATSLPTYEWMSNLPSPGAVFALVRRALGIARERACRSVLHFKELTGLSIMFACLQSGAFIVSGRRGSAATADPRSRSPAGPGVDGDSLVLQALMQAANELEDVILTGKSDVLWSSAAAAAATTIGHAPGSAAGPGHGSGPGGPGGIGIGVMPTHAHSQHVQHLPYHHHNPIQAQQQQVVMQHQQQGHHGQGTQGDAYTIMGGQYMNPF